MGYLFSGLKTEGLNIDTGLVTKSGLQMVALFQREGAGGGGGLKREEEFNTAFRAYT